MNRRTATSGRMLGDALERLVHVATIRSELTPAVVLVLTVDMGVGAGTELGQDSLEQE